MHCTEKIVSACWCTGSASVEEVGQSELGVTGGSWVGQGELGETRGVG